MQLIIDFGNTLIKFFVFDGNRINDSFKVPFQEWKDTLVKIQRNNTSITKCIISDVRGNVTEELNKALEPLPVLICNSKLNLPFDTLYNSKHKLGADRIALIAASILEYPKQNVLVIDLGSCITYDFIHKKGLHFGGSISPGFSMRYKAMHSFSGGLPLLENKAVSSLIGISTESCMRIGVTQGIISEVQEAISKYSEKYDFLTVILTGGDVQKLPKPSKSRIFTDPNFLAKGLNYILAFNTNS